jgi:UDP-glucose 4-epimerase
MEEYKAPNLIFSSSATVYSPGTYLDEETVFKPSNPYGETKIAIEYLIKSVNRANGGRTISLRYFNPVGSSKDGLLGDSPSVFPNNLFPFIEQVAVGGRPHLNIFGNDYNTPDGTGVRDYIHVVDLALGHIAALRLMIEKDS